jgi:hypothetical protein
MTNADIKYLDSLRVLGDAPGGRLRCLNTDSKEVVLSGFWRNLKKFRDLTKYNPNLIRCNYKLQEIAPNAFALPNNPDKKIVMLQDGEIVHNLSAGKFWTKIGSIAGKVGNFISTNPVAQTLIGMLPGGQGIQNLITGQSGGGSGGGGGNAPQGYPQMPQGYPQMPQVYPQMPQTLPETLPESKTPSTTGFSSFLTSNTVAGMVIGAILVKTLSKP